jgi:hypothetical protein
MENTYDFSLEALDEIGYACSPEVRDMYKLSPFVWHESDHYERGELLRNSF